MGSRYDRSLDVMIRDSLMPNSWVCNTRGKKQEWMVVKKENGWGCSCPDFQKRGEDCKHILAVRSSVFGEELQCLSNKEEKNRAEKTDNKKQEVFVLHGYDRWEVVSAFHKELRRGQYEEATYWLQVMMSGGLSSGYINNYIVNIIGEELCICDSTIITEIKSYSNYQKLDGYMLYALVDKFCDAKKWWYCERCSYRRKLWGKYIDKVKEIGNKKKIPFYAYDNHTRVGKRLWAEGKADIRWSGTWEGMLWRRSCVEQKLPILSTEYNDVVLPENNEYSSKR